MNLRFGRTKQTRTLSPACTQDDFDPFAACAGLDSWGLKQILEKIMNRMNHCSLVILLLFLVLGLSAFAQITPRQDAYTNTASPTANFGTAATLGVVSSSTSIQTTYIQF